MKISPALLHRYIADLPSGADLVALMEDVGLEVKRHEGDTWTLELLANRGDHHCYFGMAREISGRTGGPLCFPEYATLEVGQSPVLLRNETAKCLSYSATLLTCSKSGALSGEVLQTLEAAGIHSLTAPVDATNLSNLEIGQPTHAFDADKIVGGIIIRETRAGETCWPLFQEEHITLPEGTLVIADEEKILAVAGVIGCEDSKTTETTTRLLLESACFDPVAVRKASRALAIHTDSSARFERGSDPSLVLVGAGRVVHLLEQVGWHRAGTTGLVGDWTNPNRTISLDVAAANEFLATTLSSAEASERLSRYGFGCAGDSVLSVTVPPHRLWDVETPFDLYEELAKSVGYNDTPMTLPPIDMGSLPSRAETNRRRIDDVLVANGFFEVITDGFYGRDAFSRLGLPEGHALQQHVETQNALDRGYSLLKNNALLQAVQATAQNLNRKCTDIKAFEWTRTFHPDPDAENGVCTENKLLWALACGPDRAETWAGHARPADPLFVKGIVEELGTALGITLEIEGVAVEHPLSATLHPNRQASLWRDGELVGIFGEIHPRILKTHKIKRARPVYLEISEGALMDAEKHAVFVEPPDYHPIDRSIAFTLPGRIEAGEVQALLEKEGPENLSSIRIADLYAHEEDGQPVRTITYALTYANPDHDATADAVNAATEALIRAVDAQFGDAGVKLRA